MIKRSSRSVLSRLCERFRRFVASRRANVSLLFALSVLPVVGMAGAGIDLGHATKVRTSLQAALDSSALMLSKQASNLTTTQMQTTGQNYVNGIFNRTDASLTSFAVTYSAGAGKQLSVTGTATVPTYFMKIFGRQSVVVNGSSTVKWGNTRLRVALVLDNTGSMAQSNKLTALKDATNSLLTQLQNAATTNGDVYVSIVPFVKDVNVGPSNYNATWVDWTDWDSNNGSCANNNGNGWGWGWGGGSTQGSCNGTWTPSDHSTWNSCVVDRGDENGPDTGNYDTNAVTPTTATTATLYSAEQYGSCPQAAMGLSYNWSGMTTEVNAMQANGNTNQAIGLQLGWLSLTGGGPFTAPAMDPNYSYQQVIILLTDGLNTQDRWYSSQSSIDARQTLTCGNIKTAGVTLYTVEVSTDGTPVSTLLQNCATDSSKFFYLTSSTQIVTTFTQIGTAISQLYIAQ